MSEISYQSSIETAVIKTVAYFDLFEYPLTNLEIYRYLRTEEGVENAPTFLELISILENSHKLKTLLEFRQGFVFLKGRWGHVGARGERYAVADQKFKIALRGARRLSWIPFLQFVAICNNLASNNAKPEADIDLLIGVRHGRLYLTRLLVTIVLSLMGLRRHGKKITNRLCLSFYLTDQSYDLDALRIHEDDVHFAWWASQITPILGHENFDEFFQANNWLGRFIQVPSVKLPSNRRLVSCKLQVVSCKLILEKLLLGRLGNVLESLARKIQHIKFSMNTKSIANLPDTRVVINDSVLKFHENDRRLLYRDKFYQSLNSLELEYAQNNQ